MSNIHSGGVRREEEWVAGPRLEDSWRSTYLEDKTYKVPLIKDKVGYKGCKEDFEVEVNLVSPTAGELYEAAFKTQRDGAKAQRKQKRTSGEDSTNVPSKIAKVCSRARA